jgi:hypothetical protein
MGRRRDELETLHPRPRGGRKNRGGRMVDEQ